MYMLARLIHLLFGAYTMGLVVYTLLGWVRSPETARLSKWLGRYYEPLLKPIQQKIKPINLGGTFIDFSPMILIVALMLTRTLIINLLIPNFK